ncbi:hypothetical protein JDV02_002982 [Purpureocillium takamizusanense]|uniref:Uncharacterized protein n=1 Tax=Purpureocillium takamizusanense TaxID=2060973 RepID=A0A9Q8QC82_9HYPO|nr:uncharacterized protein JDV02_002982 [Purpureocillium takamizusanense]UNI16556.1 hypothetical protein JDV02_002982 [Purpureocillium takamizusanense]
MAWGFLRWSARKKQQHHADHADHSSPTQQPSIPRAVTNPESTARNHDATATTTPMYSYYATTSSDHHHGRRRGGSNNDMFGWPRPGPSPWHVLFCRILAHVRSCAVVVPVAAGACFVVERRDVVEHHAWPGLEIYEAGFAIPLTILFLGAVAWTLMLRSAGAAPPGRGCDGLPGVAHVVLALALGGWVVSIAVRCLSRVSRDRGQHHQLFWRLVAATGRVATLHEAFWVTYVYGWAWRYGIPVQDMYRDKGGGQL